MAIIEISDATDLQAMENDLAGDYEIINDIDASGTSTWNDGEGFDPVGVFTGSLDGSGYTITGLFFDRPDTSGQGLFSSTQDAHIFSVKQKEGNIKGGRPCGGFVGAVNGSSILEDLSYEGIVDVNRGGGICGRVRDTSIIRRVKADATVSGSTRTGILVGTTDDTSHIEDAYTAGSVSGNLEISLMVGWLLGSSTVDNTYSIGTGAPLFDRVNSDATVSNSFWNSDLESETGDAGTGKTTAEMKDRATFTDTATTGLDSAWDMAAEDTYDDTKTWGIGSLGGTLINDGYPFLMVFQSEPAEVVAARPWQTRARAAHTGVLGR